MTFYCVATQMWCSVELAGAKRSLCGYSKVGRKLILRTNYAKTEGKTNGRFTSFTFKKN